jgi:hypothetical protein
MKTILIGNGYWGSIVKEKLEKQTDLIGVLNSKDNIDSFLKKEVDYIFVCTPTKTHYEIVKKCIENHKNVFCEKPFTGNFFKAKELYKISEKNNTKLFVDNIFLYRNELINIESNNFKKIKFLWNKFENLYKEDLFTTLLYHDLYLLLNIAKNTWDVDYLEIFEDKLNLKLKNKNLKAEFIYDRNYIGKKEKKIFIDDKLIDFSNPSNDPLSEIIDNLIKNNINFNENKKITLKTIKLLNKIQNESILHTPRSIK